MMQDVKNLARSQSAFKLFVGADEAGGSSTTRTDSIKVMGTAAAVVIESASAGSSVEETDQETPLSSPETETAPVLHTTTTSGRDDGSSPHDDADGASAFGRMPTTQ